MKELRESAKVARFIVAPGSSAAGMQSFVASASSSGRAAKFSACARGAESVSSVTTIGVREKVTFKVPTLMGVDDNGGSDALFGVNAPARKACVVSEAPIFAATDA